MRAEASKEHGPRPTPPAPARSAPTRSTPPRGPAKRPTQTGKPAQKSVPARKSEGAEPPPIKTTQASAVGRLEAAGSAAAAAHL